METDSVLGNPQPRRSRAKPCFSIGLVLGIVLGGATVGGAIALFSFSGAHKATADLATPRTPTVRLSSGYDIPLLGLGTFGISGGQTQDAVESALRLGYKHFDTAQMYGNEAQVGAAITNVTASGALSRGDIFVTTKLHNTNHAADKVEPSVQESLQKLQTDYIDLLLVHWPLAPEIIKQTWAAMEDVVSKGLVRSIGVSNFSPEKIQKWFADAKIKPAVNQVEVHPQWRNRVVDWAKSSQYGIHITAYAPLSSPGSMAAEGRKVPNLLQDKEVAALAEAAGITPAQALLAWGLRHGASVIPKSAHASRQKENLASLDVELSDSDFNALNSRELQLREFVGKGMAFGPEPAPYRSYEDLWNEAPTEAQVKLDDL